MPNLCNNITTITLKDFDSENSADVELMDSLKLAVENSVLLMKLCPIDLDQANAVNAWGTKWDIFNTYVLSNDKGKLVFEYHTAWSPCREAFITAVSNNPRLQITTHFSEFGMCFAGEQVVNSTGETYVLLDISKLSELLGDDLDDNDIENEHSLFDSYIDTLECSDALKDYLRDCRRDF